MHRRTCIAAAASGIALAIGPGLAAAADRVWRIGVLRPGTRPPSPTDPQIVGIPNALAALGYVVGRNAAIDLRFAEGKLERLAVHARELVGAPSDVIIAVTASAIQAVKAATPTIPIVMFGNFDPVALGLVNTLARPGGNVTGVLIAPGGTLAGKRLALLRAAVPQTSRIAMLASTADRSDELQIREAQKAASALGIELLVFDATNADYDRVFADIAVAKAGALFVAASTYFLRDRARIIALAARYRLPAMYEWREQVVDGGLMSYNTSLEGLFARIASYVDRILKGSLPGDLPIEQPTKFELVVNLGTARTLRLTIPPALGLQIDEAIE